MDEALRSCQLSPQTAVVSLSERVGENVREHTHPIDRVTGRIAALLLTLVFRVGWIGAQTPPRPLCLMVQAWERLSTGDFSVRLNHPNGEEQDTLIEAFNHIVPRLEAHRHLSLSMALAQQIQRNLLPSRSPA